MRTTKFWVSNRGILSLLNLQILGYSRSELSSESLKNMISEHLTCRVDHPITLKNQIELWIAKRDMANLPGKEVRIY
ncbi:hypothetical protein GOP47_0001281 [Adiantum capillus-veneris]|uniref:Uncharacterized protein n=1 Tax=Adiantum capillus-veneris TaxID=13818 RepID=A0A9D4V8E2_ADICA|nr:hypothetical protein GOP47_0001281 [Adiantum capillus-veneris]